MNHWRRARVQRAPVNAIISRSLPLLVLISGLSSSPAAPAAAPAVPIPPAGAILATLRPEHPRLLATRADFEKLRKRTQTDPQSRRWREELRRQADRILRQPPSSYEIPDGLRLLATSRQVLHRVQTLALLHELDGEKQHLERAWLELNTAAAFKDWNTRHFLDTAEMTHAFAIGYDWLHDALSKEQRAVLRAAMVEKGLKPALEVHQQGRWWARARHNWNQVCNGGIGMGALALAEVEPELAGELLHEGLVSLQLAMAEFAPDGAWAEGPGYWDYATTYNVAILAALQTALGTDFGLSRMKGFPETGLFPIYSMGPFGQSFNYADAGSGMIRAPHMFWMARQFKQPVYAGYELARARPHPLDLLWFDPADPSAALASLPLDRYFRNAEVALLRSAWDDPNALFVGFKAGDNKANHSHLDLGSFVLDAQGVRWAADLGADDYNFPGYFGKQRWDYYRLRAEGHNTLVLNPGRGPDQDAAAAARITRFDSQAGTGFAVADLTAAYARHARQVRRGLALPDRKAVLVQDEIQADQPAEVWWFFHTAARVDVSGDGTTAMLTQGKARLQARLLSPPQAKLSVMPAGPLSSSPHPEKQGENGKFSKLAIQLKNVRDLRLAVLFTPLREGESAPSQGWPVRPLAEW
jgi:hypothetical protein